MSSFLTKIKKNIKKPFVSLAKYINKNKIVALTFVCSTIIGLFALSPSSTLLSILFSSAYGISHILFYYLIFTFSGQYLNILYRFLRFKLKTRKNPSYKFSQINSTSKYDMSSTLEILSKFDDKDPNFIRLKNELLKSHKKEEVHS